MKFIDNLVELFEQLLLLSLQVLVLLEFDFVLPLLFLVLFLSLNDSLLALCQIRLNLVMGNLFVFQPCNFLADLFHRANDQLICIFLDKPFFVGSGVFLFLLLQITTKCPDQVQICLCDCSVVLLDVGVLLLVLCLQV